MNSKLTNNNIHKKYIIKIKTKYYFFLIKNRQLFVFNFFNWSLIGNKLGVWFYSLWFKNKIFTLHNKIKVYRVAHPWKYMCIRLSIFGSLKLTGGGFLIPCIVWPPLLFKLGKVTYVVSQMSPAEILMGLVDLNWKKITVIGTVVVAWFFLYKNLDFLYEKFCIVYKNILNRIKDLIDANGSFDPKDPKDPKDPFDPKDPKDPFDPKGPKGPTNIFSKISKKFKKYI